MPIKVNKKRLAKSWLSKEVNYLANNYSSRLSYFDKFTDEFVVIDNWQLFPGILNYPSCELMGNTNYPHAILVYYCDFINWQTEHQKP